MMNYDLLRTKDMLNISITSYTTFIKGISSIYLVLPYTQYTCLMLEALHSLPFPARINSDEAGSFFLKRFISKP